MKKKDLRIEINKLADSPFIVRSVTKLAPQNHFEKIIKSLNNSLGLVLASNYEFPSRYSMWNFGFSDPILMFESRQGKFEISAKSDKGEGIVLYFHDILKDFAECEVTEVENMKFSGCLVKNKNEGELSEEDRTKKTSTFSVIRQLWQAIQHSELKDLGLYGSFGYDLIFEFEDIQKQVERDENQRDVVLFIPDEIFKSTVGDDKGTVTSFDFEYKTHDSRTAQNIHKKYPFVPNENLHTDVQGDHSPGEYERTVDLAKKEFVQGNLFEVVPGQTFNTKLQMQPSEFFVRLTKTNPSPYAFFMNLGETEFLIGASPEMFVRSTGSQIETCPISGTIKRGVDPIDDAAQIQKLLASKKDEAELNMCTDVDRNDKARICVPGSVYVKGRRQIEIYSKLIHTVDHVVGELAEGYDALDAFISHMWAVTVTGAPKMWAVNFLEQHEKTCRNWYAGATGGLMGDGSINTALNIRMIQVKNGMATVRAGATILYYSDAKEEEKETRLKASAIINVLTKSENSQTNISVKRALTDQKTKHNNILVIDHEDSFVNMLSSYFKSFDQNVKTYRYSQARSKITSDVDLIVMSPGPGKPSNFDTNTTIKTAIEQQIPIFGVCLGLQAIVEYFGGELGVLSEPCHGIPTKLTHCGEGIFKNLPQETEVARYHSLYAIEDKLPAELIVTARSEDGVIMAISHKKLPIHAVQFHPESIISSRKDFGRILIGNVIETL